MYSYPYGDEQQLNLNWIINEIINLHKQLDPNYETPSFTQVYPYSNLNRLNLDWVLSELKALKELAPEPVPTEVDIQAVAEALVALPFDSSKAYQIYDYISRDGEIWRATEAISAGGEWDETKWFKTKLGIDLAVLDRWINTINADLTTLQNTVENLSSDEISDDSDAGGATVKESLNNLKGSLTHINSQLAPIRHDAAVEQSIFSEGGCYYYEVGNMVFVNVTNLKFIAANSGTNTFITGLPAPASDVAVAIFSYTNKNLQRLRVTTNGTLENYWSDFAANEVIFGQFWYRKT